MIYNTLINKIREFAKQYNKIVEICFNDCVNDFTTRKVLPSESTCSVNCLDKYLKMNQRVSQRFQGIIFYFLNLFIVKSFKIFLKNIKC